MMKGEKLNTKITPELLTGINETVESKAITPSHKRVLQTLNEVLPKLKINFIIRHYELIETFLFLRISCQDEESVIEIEVAKTSIEFRGSGYEMEFFFDDSAFQEKDTELVTAFFHGDYSVVKYLGKNERVEAFGVNWEDCGLEPFNIKKEPVRFFRRQIHNEVAIPGIKLVELS